ncbi:MAG TPA: NAD(P)-dependent oxidoreductase [Gemmataceae bacterium]|nr:NAD(P)-dependent oxidoreductase [Gemmataceae bacterium]
MKRILVVGGAGYIGGYVTDRLLQAGYPVRVYDNLLYEEKYLKEVDFVRGDVLDKERLRPHLSWADAVVWLAALVGDGACALNPTMTEAINHDILKWVVRVFDRRLVFMSTCSVYGAQDGILNEDSPVNPLSLYAKTKVEAEKVVAPANAITFRLGTIFGVGDRFSRLRLDLVVNLLTVKACLYRRMSVYGGAQYRPLLHVKDVAEAIVPNIETTHRGVYNLLVTNMTILDAAQQITQLIPGVKIETTELQFQDARNYRVSGEKARAAFGFQPKLTVLDGIREIKTLTEEGRISDIYNTRYSNAEYLRPLLKRDISPLGYEVVPDFQDRRAA